MARLTGLEPATSGVTGRGIAPCVLPRVSSLGSADLGPKSAKVETSDPRETPEKKKAGAAGTAAGHTNALVLENVTATLDESKWKRTAEAVRSFNALTAIEQRAFAVGISPAIFGDEAWPMFALWARQHYGVPLPSEPPADPEEIELIERKWLMARLWRTLTADERLSFLRKQCTKGELREVAR